MNMRQICEKRAWVVDVKLINWGAVTAVTSKSKVLEPDYSLFTTTPSQLYSISSLPSHRRILFHSATHQNVEG